MKLSAVEKIDNINSEQFLSIYKKTTTPVVVTQLTQHWPARKQWSLEYIKNIAGNKEVPLYDSVPSTDRKHQHAPAVTMSLAQYIDHISNGHNDLRLFFYNFLTEIPALTEDFSYPDIGLKFFKKLPVLFIGAAGTKVQMHFDIDWADIFLCHFGGKKKVILFPPSQTKNMYHVPYSFSSLYDINYEQPDFNKYPALRNLSGLETILEHGDILYIPPGYWHYIVYQETSFSMALRAFPRSPKNFLRMLRNLLVTRTVEGLMRKIIGQPWNDRNEKLAILRTNKMIR
ncbi:MAG: cupin-like domain-containing protein [Gammaproteobacteria bacterium]|nr:cupin-like domain-containing protein [Gammaproteobacteria bacterium]